MNASRTRPYYPIFLNWNSAILATYGEQLTQVTQGQTDTALARKLLSPAYLLADAGRRRHPCPGRLSNPSRETTG